ncbi:hypothetical protein D3C85_402530 [compost metagenome]
MSVATNRRPRRHKNHKVFHTWVLTLSYKVCLKYRPIALNWHFAKPLAIEFQTLRSDLPSGAQQVFL